VIGDKLEGLEDACTISEMHVKVEIFVLSKGDELSEALLSGELPPFLRAMSFEFT
jgi:hypothetical protein